VVNKTADLITGFDIFVQEVTCGRYGKSLLFGSFYSEGGFDCPGTCIVKEDDAPAFDKFSHDSVPNFFLCSRLAKFPRFVEFQAYGYGKQISPSVDSLIKNKTEIFISFALQYLNIVFAQTLIYRGSYTPRINYKRTEPSIRSFALRYDNKSRTMQS
jgi:hypothetical protein